MKNKYRALETRNDNLNINHFASNFGFFLLGLLCGALIVLNIWMWSLK